MQPNTTAPLSALEAPCARCPPVERCKAERLACGAAQVFYFGGKRWAHAPRNDAARWRHEWLFERRLPASNIKLAPPSI